jgi:hypothetical protein
MSKDTLSRLKKTESLLIKARNLAKAANLVKSTAQYRQMLGDVEAHKEVFDTAKKMPNSNWGTWVVRNYKKDPAAFKKHKDAIEHYSGMTHLDEVNKVRFDKNHSLEDGIKMLKEAEGKGLSRTSTKDTAGNPTEADGERITEPINGLAWYDLGRGSCEKEAASMGHCGNGPSKKAGDRLLSLRRVLPDGRHEPHLTFIENSGVLGEMKGKANMKPSAAYHDNIVQLLQHDRIKSIKGGGYEPHKNFDLDDLSEEKRNKVIQSKPEIDPKHYPKDVLDKKFKSEGLGLDNPRLWQNKNITPDHINEALKSDNYIAHALAMSSPNASAENISLAIKDGDRKTRKAALQNPNATAEHVEQALSNRRNSDARSDAMSSPKATTEQIGRGLSDSDRFVRAAALKNKNATANHVGVGLKDEFVTVRAEAAKHPNATANHLSIALKDEHEFVRQAAASSPNATTEHISTALKDADDSVRLEAARNPNATAENISTALKDRHPSIRTSAAEHPNATAENISAALKDEDSDVRQVAIGHPKVASEHISTALNDKHSYVREVAAKHPKASKENITQALTTGDFYIRAKALANPNANEKHVSQGLKDESHFVVGVAKQIAKDRFPHLLKN